MQVSSIKRVKFPEAQFKGMAELGLMGVAVPEEWGGAGMDNVSYALASEELGWLYASCGVITSVNNSLVNDPLFTLRQRRAKRKNGSSQSPGAPRSVVLHFQSLGPARMLLDRALWQKKKGNEWVIRGAKNWITNGAQADLCIVFAMGDKSKA